VLTPPATTTGSPAGGTTTVGAAGSTPPTTVEPSATSGAIPSAAPTATAEAPAVAAPVGPADGTYIGDSVGTRYGDVQVSVTLTGGQISEVTALQLTSADGRSVQISNRAAPILRDEVVASQSAAVSNVGGATYTTDAYLASLQSALDQAGF
jgi:uncharacterized protein with FMN-binding domain